MLPVEALIEKFPSKSVVAPVVVPFTTILAPGSGFPSSSWTDPEIWALAAKPKNANR